MAVTEEFNTPHSGGWNDYPNRVTKYIFFGDKKFDSKPATIKSGQVLKAFTFLESDSAGKMIAHTGLTEDASVLINGALVSTNTLTVGTGGIVFTVGSGGATADQLANAIAVLTPAMTTTQANTALLAAGIATTVGTYTSGTAPAFTFTKIATATVLAEASTAGDVTNLAVAASTGTAPTVTIKSGATVSKIAGVTMYDVDATSADVDAEVYAEASFFANDDGSCALLWKIDPAVDKVGTVACTTYNTGCSGTSAASNLLKMKFVEDSEFELAFLGMGVGA